LEIDRYYFDLIYFRNSIADNKRQYESRINQLEEELEEERTSVEISDEKIKKMQLNYEQVLNELSIERTNSERLEVRKPKVK